MTYPNDFMYPQESGNEVRVNGTILGPGKTTGGLTKREYFAVMALQGLSSRMANSDRVAELAVEYADALIKQLNEREKK